jgi:hypothetical protein
MPEATSMTRWRDKPIVPQDYEDIDGIVRVARKARGRIVEFEWAFTQDELVWLRRAVFEWGSGVVGRYKCFDARVLAAINEALSETNTIFVLNEPKNIGQVDCRVACDEDGDRFWLRGHAPFDIVFGYGSAGIEQDPLVSVHLGPSAQETLASAVGMLGWDLRRLQESRFLPVKNVLYGLRVGYGIQEVKPAPGPTVDVNLHFHGPFSAVDEGESRCLFADKIAKIVGVYLWTIEVDGRELPWYVGQTRRGFGTRMGEHFAGILSGRYTVYDAAALSRGEHRLALGAGAGDWPQSLPLFLRNYESLMPNIINLLRLIRIHVAPLVGDAHLYNRVEGAIGRHFKTHPDPKLRDFFAPGLRVPAAIPFDNPIRLVISSEVPVAGLPPQLQE